MAGCKLYINGGIGSRAQGEGFGPDYELNNFNNYCETCASIANVYWNHRMFLATGHSKYIDVLERALYNGVIAGVSLDGDKFFYDNPLASEGVHHREEWFGCACCPGNVTRFMASVPKYIYATGENCLYVNLYIDGKVNTHVAGKELKIIQETGYPWDGKVTIEVMLQEASSFSLNLRIPGWSQEEPVPGSDLYRFISPSDNKYSIQVNGEEYKTKPVNGYAEINRRWEPGDKAEIVLPMEVRKVQSHENVKDNKGLLAITRGPIVYCMEGTDQPDRHVFNKYVAAEEEFIPVSEPEKLGGIVALKGSAKEISDLNGEVIEREVPVTAIPYSTWNNRGKAEMRVWIPATKEYAHPVPGSTIASRAKSYTVVSAPIQKDGLPIERREWCYGVNDQWDPESSADQSKPYHYFWLKRGSEESIEYEFDQPYTVSNTEVYWLEFDHYDENYRVPASWKLQYKSGNGWKDVEAKEPYGCEKDRYNSVDFTPVTTTGLKLVVQLQDGESGGVIEWKVN